MPILAAFHFPSQLELAGRIVLAGALGGFIGVERELADHPAGLRTHISVALGAALFAVLSGYGFGAFQAGRNDTNFQVDPTRVASQIVVGVGFLGGGAILKYGAGVKGLTTAASLWVTAAIGAAVGLGSWIMAAVTTGAMLMAMVLLRRPSHWLHRHALKGRATVVIHMSAGQDPSDVVARLCGLADTRLTSLKIEEAADGVDIHARLVADSGQRVETAVASLAGLPGVADISMG